MSLLDSLPPGAQPDTDIVTSKVLINGSPLSNEIDLAQITIGKSFNKIAWARLVFLDGSASDQDFPLSDDDKFKPGNPITVQLGYGGQANTVFDGIIIKHAIKVRQNGQSTLLIEAKDKAVKLAFPRNSAYYLNSKDSDVITQLATGLQTDVDDTRITHAQLVQFDSSNWDFIVTRAEANKMMVLTDDGKLSVKALSTSGNPVYTATYGQDMYEFDAEMDARRQADSITSRSWDYTSQATEESDPGAANFSENGNISSADLGQVLGADVVLLHSGHLASQQLQAWSDSYALRNRLSKAVGRLRVDGNSSVKPGNLITLKGVGDRFNGNVLVTGILHQFDGNWYTDIQFGWRDEWFFTKEDVNDAPAGGLLPAISGLQVGRVTDLDDTDQGGQYRVKVEVPIIKSGETGIWARVSTLDAGSNRGTYFRPQKGDEVVLGFLNGDPREAIILGYMHSKNNKQSPLPIDNGALQYGYVSQKGVSLIFDDTNQRLTLKTPSGKAIVFNDGSNAIALSDDNGNTITLDSSGITIQAGSGKNVTIKGLKVMIN
jgi:Rhs element Vgr protein